MIHGTLARQSTLIRIETAHQNSLTPTKRDQDSFDATATMPGSYHRLADRALHKPPDTMSPHIYTRDVLNEHPQSLVIRIGAFIALITSVLGLLFFFLAKKCRDRRRRNASIARAQEVEHAREEMLQRARSQLGGNVDMCVRRDANTPRAGRCR
jgi:hypothetical protein